MIEDSCGVADSWSRLIDIAGIEKLASVDAIPLRMADSVPPVTFGYAPYAIRETYLSVDDIVDGYSRSCVINRYPDHLLLCIT